MEFEFNHDNDTHKLERIKSALHQIALDKTTQAEVPNLVSMVTNLKNAEKLADMDDVETAFLNLYCEIHHAGSSYSQLERDQLDQRHGYFNHPGGISPLLKAEQFIQPETTSVDLGAGNGLQGLLFQLLYPHKHTIQVELSTEMINFGKKLQRVLNIPTDRVTWINEDIMNVPFEQADFIYLYRPSKPIKSGIKLYHHIAGKLDSIDTPMIIFSIADCLKDFISPKYDMFYTDGHLTCFQHNHPIFS